MLLGRNVTLRCVVSQKNHTIRVNWTKNNKPLAGAYIINHAQVRPQLCVIDLNVLINSSEHSLFPWGGKNSLIVRIRDVS